MTTAIARVEDRLKLAMKKLGDARHLDSCTCDTCALVAELSADLVTLQDEARREAEGRATRDRLRGEVTRERIVHRRAAAQKCGERAVQDLLASSDVPEVMLRFGPVTVIVSFKTIDVGLAQMAAEAVRRAATMIQLAWRDRLAGVRTAASEGRPVLDIDGEAVAHALRGGLEFWIARGLVRIDVKNSRATVSPVTSPAAGR